VYNTLLGSGFTRLRSREHPGDTIMAVEDQCGELRRVTARMLGSRLNTIVSEYLVRLNREAGCSGDNVPGIIVGCANAVSSVFFEFLKMASCREVENLYKLLSDGAIDSEG